MDLLLATNPATSPRRDGDHNDARNTAMYSNHAEIVVAHINCYGQTKLPVSKQLEIQNFVSVNKIDILHMQECLISDETFQTCKFITSNFNNIPNNTPTLTHFGTASLVRCDIEISNIHRDDQGRAIVFDAVNCTWANLYLPSGNQQKQLREEYSSRIIPQLLSRKLASGSAGGDLNCITASLDSSVIL